MSETQQKLSILESSYERIKPGEEANQKPYRAEQAVCVELRVF